jgi:leucyl aminopeptidase
MLLTCLTAEATEARPVVVVTTAGYEPWRERQPEPRRRWLEASGFRAKAGRVALLPGADGSVEAALLVTAAPAAELWDFAALRDALPAGDWRLEAVDGEPDLGAAALGFALADYRFDRYRKVEGREVRLVVGEDAAVRRARAVAEGVHLARDLINTPASDLGPAELAEAARRMAERHGARYAEVAGDELIERNFPAIHAVGRASARPPRFLEFARGDEAGAPKVTLVGKGVCFDTGGLDIKPSDGMLLMKKDMGGAAIMLGLAHAVMALDLPVRLRVLVAAVENSISGTAFRPGDVLRTRKGLTVEIGNTDAEGRLILADALAEADRERPDLMVDAATLTGAARVALGPDLPALFTPDDGLADELLQAGRAASDPLWRLPLHAPYRELIDSPVADINNAGQGRFAGSITAALFLKEFVSDTRAWAHLDVYAWNPGAKPGRPKGGEATALRALFTAIERRYGRAT